MRTQSSETQAPSLKPIHPFPARMAPAILWDELPETEKPLTVLDPMTGSGTTVATARLRGHRALGFDTDPLAVLLASAWSMDVSPEQIKTKAAEALDSARRVYRLTSSGEAYPSYADDETRKFLRYWFDDTSRKQLFALSSEIQRVSPKSIRPLLLTALSRTIIVKSVGVSLAMDVAHSRPHRVYDRSPVKPFEVFEHAAATVARNSPFVDGTKRPAAEIQNGDARSLRLPDRAVDMVVTSPPYLNAIDYLRGHRMSLVWMGHNLKTLRGIRGTNVGSEVSLRAAQIDSEMENVLKTLGETSALSSPDLGMLRRYVHDLAKVIQEIARVLKPKGRAVFVVGNSSVSGVFVRNSAAIEALGKLAGLELLRQRSRPLPENKRYLPPPEALGAGRKLSQRMREEVILTFAKI